jgi:hypothetical protein
MLLYVQISTAPSLDPTTNICCGSRASLGDAASHKKRERGGAHKRGWGSKVR